MCGSVKINVNWNFGCFFLGLSVAYVKIIQHHNHILYHVIFSIPAQTEKQKKKIHNS